MNTNLLEFVTLVERSFAVAPRTREFDHLFLQEVLSPILPFPGAIPGSNNTYVEAMEQDA